MKHKLFLLLLPFFFAGCTKYERMPNCTLDKMNLHGNVVKVETIMQSTVPYTEMLTDNYNPNAAVSIICGNLSLDFDNHGNIKAYKGYGIDGKELFSTHDLIDQDTMEVDPSILGISDKLPFNNIKVVKSAKGKVIGANFTDNGELVYKENIYYNKHGDILRIIKNYEKQKIKIDDIVLERADTTYFYYLEYDEHHNWTEAQVIYKGLIPRQNDSYKIKRQITYDSEGHKEPLINELDEYNRTNTQQALPCNYNNVELQNYGHISIPDFMISDDDSKAAAMSVAPEGSVNYLYAYQYKRDDAYATILISTSPNNDQIGFDDYSDDAMQYDSETDKIYKEQFIKILAQTNIFMLKWLPYKFEKVNGKNAMVIRYYRYGKNSPIPVYVESYTFSVLGGQYMTVCYSFQSNMFNRFQAPFQEAIGTTEFN